MAAESGPPGAPPPPPPPPLSPPKAEVDDSPLQKSMDKNKESLKVKLMLRRPINQLVAQGIMPPLKTPPAFHEQRQKLERAKTGDLLKAKIQQRPDRQELVRQHILEVDVGHVDPSLAERQRMLKKCRLADALNDQLSHRPGILELIKKNILHTEEPIERAVKEGHIEFKATCEGQKTKPQPPDHYMTLDDDSLSSEATSPLDLLSSPPHDSQGMLPDTQDILTDPSGMLNTELLTQCRSTLPETRDILHDALSGTRDVLETAAAQAGIVTVVVTPTLLATTAPSPSLSLTSSLSPLSSISSPPSMTSRSSQSFSGKDKNRKKCKTKTQPKTRTIKFHEYKGPPNAHKTSPLSASPVETSYELLLQQQQLFLQWQLEWQHKYPQIILPASQKPPDPTPSLITVTTAPPAPPPPPSTQPPPPPPPPVPDTRPLRNLEDMKVSDLKAELKKRNLPVSGAKPQLIERLKPFSESAANTTSINTNTTIPTSEDSLLSVCQVSPPPQALSIHSGGSICDPDSPPAPPQPPTPTPAQSPGSPASSVAMETEMSEEIIREQRRRIEQLQRQLLRSQMQLQQQQQQQTTFQPQQSLNAKASLAAFLQQQQLNQLLLQQSQQQQQLLGIANNNHINSNNNNNKLQQQQTRTNGVVSPQQHQQQALVINQINLKGNQNLRTSSLPNFLGTFVQSVPNVVNESVKIETQPASEMLEDKPIPSPSSLPSHPPPLYHDATKLLRVKQVFDNTPAAKEGTLQSGDELVGVNGNSVKGKTKVEVAKMIQACKDEVQIKYNKLHADPQRGKTLDIILKKVKHRLVENMSTTTADALGLSRAILCNDTLVQKLEELESTEAMYRGLVDHTKRVLKAFFGLLLVYKDFGDAFAAIGVREPQPRASEAFSRFGDYHRQMEKFGIETLRAIKPILSDLGTYLNKAIPDTKLTIRKYADTKFEYLSYCLQVKEKDDEEYSYSALQEPLYRVETGNYEYRLILRCRQDARNRFARLRSDVSVKLELLGNKHVQDVVWQLHKLVAGLASFHAHTLQLLKDNALFPIEMDLSRSAFNYKSTSPIVNDEEEEDDDEILQPAEEALEEKNNDLIEGVEPLNVNQDSTKESVPSFMEDLSSLTLSQDLLSDLQPTPVTSLTIQPITSVQSSTEEKTPTATLIGFD